MTADCVCSGIGNAIDALLRRLVFAQFSLVDSHEVIGQTLSLHGVRNRDDFLDALGRVRIHKAEVLKVLRVRSRELKVGRDVPRQSRQRTRERSISCQNSEVVRILSVTNEGFLIFYLLEIVLMGV